jgi:hypothetical protein
MEERRGPAPPVDDPARRPGPFPADGRPPLITWPMPAPDVTHDYVSGADIPVPVLLLQILHSGI